MIRELLTAAVQQALVDAELPAPDGGIELDPTKQKDHGDFQTNVALKLAKRAGRPPREVAGSIVASLETAAVAHVERIEIAGPGFINFFLRPTWLHEVLRAVVAAGDRYGASSVLAGQHINLEFVSANPTGPLHAGGGRWAAVGDALANLLITQGADVHREYYLNDTGAQLGNFANSLMARYHGQKPDEQLGYHGQYVIDMATEMRTELGDSVTVDEAAEWGYQYAVRALHEDLARIGVQFDTWSSERALHARGDVEAAVAKLTADGHTYEEGGALWLRTSEHGDQRDRVLRKSDGSFTYLAGDIAYHADKLARGSNHLIDIWGADHHGQIASLQTAMRLMIGREQTPEVMLGQFVTLMKDGREVRISKRTGNIITLADILDDVDADVTRFVFLLLSLDTAQTFDVDVVTKQSMDNPVYYVQYAHARIASIGRKAAEAGVVRPLLDGVDLSLLSSDRELELLRSLAEYPDVLTFAAEQRSPQRVTTWVRELAGRFHGFYHDHSVLQAEDDDRRAARLWLVEACQIGLANALRLLGVSAPERMDQIADADRPGDGDGS